MDDRGSLHHANERIPDVGVSRRRILAGVGSGVLALAGFSATASAAPSRSLVVEATGEFAQYDFTVSEGLASRSHFDGRTDWVWQSSGGGTVDGQGRDEFVFAGEITAFSHDGPLRVTVDGEVVDPATLGGTTGTGAAVGGAGTDVTNANTDADADTEVDADTETDADTGASSTDDERGTVQVVLSFDDGEPSAKTGAKPIMDEYGYPGVTGISTGRIAQDGEDDELTVAQLEEMQADDWEVASHTVTHPDLTEIPTEEVHEECRQSRQFIAENGLLPPDPTLIYPSGGVNDEIAEIASEYYTYGFGGGEDDPTDGIDQPLQISRAAGEVPNEGREQIDRAIERGGVSVLMFHRIGSSFDEPKDSDMPEDEFAELMGYIDEQGDALEVITASGL